MNRVTLGNTGIEVSQLAIGTGTNGWAHASDQTKKKKKWLARTLADGQKFGVTFWDLADQYGSHPDAAAALELVDRRAVEIMTKTTSSTYEACKSDLTRFRSELGVEYLDIVLLHCMTSGTWPEQQAGAMKALSEAKAKGMVGAVGVSCHSLEALSTAAAEPWVEILLSRINYDGENMDGPPSDIAPVLRQAYENGKGVIGMKVYGCGKLAGDTSKAMEYVLGLGSIHAVTIGPTEDDHLEQNVRLVEGYSTHGAIASGQ